MEIAVSSAHGLKIRGAKGLLDEVDESRKVVDRVAELLRGAGVGMKVFHDDVSKSQSTNLAAILNYHNAQTRDLDVSVHFNAHTKTSQPRGTEVLYLTQRMLAAKVAAAIAVASGLVNRGAKPRSNLAFLNRTNKPATLIEVCFVDSKADVEIYREHFEAICRAIASSIGNVELPAGE